MRGTPIGDTQPPLRLISARQRETYSLDIATILLRHEPTGHHREAHERLDGDDLMDARIP
jgi:hypothetical protein